MNAEAKAYEAIRLAQLHAANGAAMMSSALFALRDAEKLFEEGSFGTAYAWAVTSLTYSVSIFHADCQRAKGLAIWTPGLAIPYYSLDGGRS